MKEGGGFRINCVISLARKARRGEAFLVVCVGVGGLEVWRGGETVCVR